MPNGKKLPKSLKRMPKRWAPIKRLAKGVRAAFNTVARVHLRAARGVVRAHIGVVGKAAGRVLRVRRARRRR